MAAVRGERVRHCSRLEWPTQTGALEGRIRDFLPSSSPFANCGRAYRTIRFYVADDALAGRDRLGRQVTAGLLSSNQLQGLLLLVEQKNAELSSAPIISECTRNPSTSIHCQPSSQDRSPSPLLRFASIASHFTREET